jgi:hypothetical protein
VFLDLMKWAVLVFVLSVDTCISHISGGALSDFFLVSHGEDWSYSFQENRHTRKVFQDFYVEWLFTAALGPVPIFQKHLSHFCKLYTLENSCLIV